MIPEGEYAAKVMSPLQWEASTKGKADQVSLRVQLLEGPGEGQPLTWRGYMTESTMERTREALVTMGWDGESDSSVLAGPRFIAVIRHEEFDGKTRARIAFINSLSGSGGNYEVMTAVQRSAAMARLRAAGKPGGRAHEPIAAPFSKF